LCHRATEDFPIRQVSRFDTRWLEGQLAAVESRQRPELQTVTPLLRSGLEEGAASPGAVNGVIHGDLFRDNVRWEGDTIVGLLDWESASDGVLAFDIMVTVLAWCFGDTLDWGLARSLVDGYQTQRPIGPAEASTLRQWGIAAATRFSITRILSYHLRDDAVGDRVMKDYRRFVQRLELLRGMEATEVARRLTA
jgi:homoserine kinase type II